MASNGNVLFLYRNLADAGTVTASSAATPAARVQDMRPGRYWRGTGPTGDWLQIDLGAVSDLTHAAAIGHNLTVTGTIRCRVGNDPAWATALYDSTNEAWPPVSGFGSDSFGVSLGGYPIVSQYTDYRAYNIFDLGGTIQARYVRFDFTGSNVQVGRIFAGLGYQPSHNFKYGWDYEWVDPSEVVDTESSVFVVRRSKYRVLRLSLEHLPRAEALSSLDDLKRIVGKSRDLLVVMFPDASLPIQYRTSVYGIPIEQGPIGNPYFQRFATSMTVRELTA